MINVVLDVGRKATVHVANAKDGFAFPLCGGRYRIDRSCTEVSAPVTCKRCKGLDTPQPHDC